jgi:S-DNA-T family DNA segregation ATPase FtsK/SpoIIIE
MGYSATEIDPKARGVGWLRAEDGIPRRVKAAYLTDEDIIHVAAWAAQARAHPLALPGTEQARLAERRQPRSCPAARPGRTRQCPA